MKFTQRIEKITSQIYFNTIVDIATDHGYIPIYALLTAKSNFALACDINQKPLNNAKKNIKLYALEDKIKTRLSNGFSKILENEVDTAIIAGIGGGLTIKILEDSPQVVSSLKQLILSPQSDIPDVRKKIHNIEFKIKNELIVFEDDKFYHIINCVKGLEIYNEKEYILGKILLKTQATEFLDYLDYEKQSLQKIITILENVDNTPRKKLEELYFLRNVYDI